MPIKLSLKGVGYSYEKFEALRSVSFDIDENQIIGLIGRNGSGKTTLLKVISNQLKVKNGEVKIDNLSFSDSDSLQNQICLARETLGKTFEQSEIMKIKDIFKIAGLLYKNWDNAFAERLIKRYKLDTKKKYNKLSKGMKTTVGIIIGLASRAEITLFDEPYVGLDPVAREIFYAELQKDYNENPRTIIISSHLINELEGIFEKVIIIDEGKILINDETEKIQERYYLLQGRKKIIEKHLPDLKVLNIETIGSLASYSVEGYISEEKIRAMKAEEIEISKISLQKLLYYLTNGGETYEQ
ncbi:MAG TPA: ABC transporter ATP-binding protein [Thermotogota bacterium]|nr:ABC transporter ATP-binding protein [Thermotogota bacterium]